MQNIYLAPLQGYTDHIFREIYHRHFSGIDRYFTPFILRDGETIRKKDSREIANTLAHKSLLTPQIMGNNPDDICWLASHLKQEGYNEINLNIGCPFPMLVRRKMGSGMLPFPELIEEILSSYFKLTDLPELSIKMRLGQNTPEEIIPIINILNNYPLSEIILHPRTGKQQYKGTTDLTTYKQTKALLTHPLVYNGDINTTEDLARISETIPISSIMIGRGVLSDPFLPERIKGITSEIDELSRLADFHDAIFIAQKDRLSGDAHLLQKMLTYWEYLSTYFEDSKKVHKALKKAKNIEKYSLLVRDLLR